jgi:predicted outer membrane repeat protein
MRSWIRKLFTRPVSRSIRKAPHRARPWLEALEDRTVPSTFTVTNTLDDGSVGSLRWAVGQANSTTGADTIVFDKSVFATPQTIHLGGSQLELSDTTGATTIIGPNKGVTVDGGGLSRVFQVDSLVTASISGLSITGGNAGYDGYGGGLRNNGTLTLSNCTVSGNSATNGGGLYNRGTATLTNCTVSGNSATRSGGGYGGFGGGVFSYGTATLSNCTVSGNSATNGGGGLYTNGTARLTNCAVSGNSATTGGGLYNYGTATLTNCTVSGNSATNSGGGVFNSLRHGTATLTNCTVSGNSAVAGGGIASQGTLNVAFSNIINNQATSKGGGISTTDGNATITNSSIYSNQVISSGIALGGGISSENSVLSLTNCTVKANEANGATAQGGGIYADNSTVDLLFSSVNVNKANGSVLGEGGGIYSLNSALTLLATDVKGNKATTDFDDLFIGP